MHGVRKLSSRSTRMTQRDGMGVPSGDITHATARSDWMTQAGCFIPCTISNALFSGICESSLRTQAQWQAIRVNHNEEPAFNAGEIVSETACWGYYGEANESRRHTQRSCGNMK